MVRQHTAMDCQTVIRESRIQATARLVLCGTVVAMTIWAIQKGEGASVSRERGMPLAVFGALFFGLLGFRYLWSLIRPGYLIIKSDGLLQDLGWRKLEWKWSELAEVRLDRTAYGLIAVCLVLPHDQPPVRLFGWQKKPSAILRLIENRIVEWRKHHPSALKWQ